VEEVPPTFLRTVADGGGISFIPVDLAGVTNHSCTGWNAASASPQHETCAFTPQNSDHIEVRLGMSGTTGTCVIQSIVLKGSGINPFGIDNCTP